MKQIKFLSQFTGQILKQSKTITVRGRQHCEVDEVFAMVDETGKVFAHAKCTEVMPIAMYDDCIIDDYDNTTTDRQKLSDFASKCGFDSWAAMVDWYRDNGYLSDDDGGSQWIQLYAHAFEVTK
jgi:hypothetical protein